MARARLWPGPVEKATAVAADWLRISGVPPAGKLTTSRRGTGDVAAVLLEGEAAAALGLALALALALGLALALALAPTLAPAVALGAAGDLAVALELGLATALGAAVAAHCQAVDAVTPDRKSTRLNSSHL